MRKFVTIWLGQLISILGSGLTSFALGVWIFDQTGQATPFALTVLFGSLPRILLSPLAGSLADRWNRRRMMILADSGDALVTLGVVALLSFGNLAVWHVYLIALVSASFAAFQEPAYTASITMLVPKKDLARASGLVQMSQAIEMLVAPALAGVLFLSIGLRGIIFIDFLTYIFAVGVLLFVAIPQPKLSPDEAEGPGSFVQDALFGWRYLRARVGLFGLLLYFALVNFSVNFAAVLAGPLVLSFAPASTLGLVQMVSGLGMFVGSVLMSAWGGPQRRVYGVIGFITLGAFGLLIAGARPLAFFPAAGLFLLLFCVPLASGPSQAIFQSKVAPEVQGRVFAMRTMISRSMMPMAFLLAGPLADYIFEPWMQSGWLSSTIAGDLLGVGPGRGIGLMFALSGTVLVLASAMALANPRIRLVEDELPDVLPEEQLGADTSAGKQKSPQPVARPTS